MRASDWTSRAKKFIRSELSGCGGSRLPQRSGPRRAVSPAPPLVVPSLVTSGHAFTGPMPSCAEGSDWPSVRVS
jgi:hypothetical protein